MQSIFQYRKIRAQIPRDIEKNSALTSTDVGGKQETHDLSGTENEDSNAPILVVFDELDPTNPLEWPLYKKRFAMFIISMVTFIVGFGSSVDAPVIPQASDEFHVSDVAESLATALYLIGFGCGAPIAGPLSEAFGRSPVYISTFALFCVWIMAAALAPNLGAQLVFRFFAGFCGATPFTTAGGTLGDLYSPQERGKVFPPFAFLAFFGPTLAPVVGGYVGHSGISWRWTEWITLIIAGFTLILLLFFLPETYGPIILKWKAEALRSATKNPQYEAAIEVAGQSLRRRFAVALSRPIRMFLTEPILVLFTLYLTFVYMITFSFFSAYPFVFGKTYNFSQGSTYLMFVGIIVGLLIVLILMPLWGKLLGYEFARATRAGRGHPPPEAMLWFAMCGAPCVPIAMFWMGWSAKSDISYWSPLVASAFFGFSLLTIFISTYTYVIQAFGQYAASALVFLTSVRYIVGGSMVVVAIPMFENLGVHHAMTILGAISCAFLPIPYVFYFYGEKIRGMSSSASKAH